MEQKRKDLEAEKGRKRVEAERNAAENDPEAAQALLRHVNHRISDQLKALYPEARWEWKTKNPPCWRSMAASGASVCMASRSMSTLT